VLGWGACAFFSFFMQCSGLRTLSHTLSRQSPRTPPPSVRMLMDLLPGCCLHRLRCIPQRQRLWRTGAAAAGHTADTPVPQTRGSAHHTHKPPAGLPVGLGSGWMLAAMLGPLPHFTMARVTGFCRLLHNQKWRCDVSLSNGIMDNA